MDEKTETVIETQPVSTADLISKKLTDNSPGSDIEQLLTDRKEIIVHQLLDVVEVLFGWERISRYQVLDSDDNQLLYIYEVADCYARQCLGGLREFTMKITDDDGVDVLKIHRPVSCSSRCFWVCCNLQQLEILHPSGTKIASVHEVWSCTSPIFHIFDQSNELLYKMVGEICHYGCCSNIVFKIEDLSGEVVSIITKLWTGCKNIIGASNDFKIEYENGLDSEQRSIILGASFLIDANYFQRKNRLCWF